ncbi:hypothetical protein LPJ79_004712, partial [Coemansia sp. RSA 1821]
QTKCDTANKATNSLLNAQAIETRHTREQRLLDWALEQLRLAQAHIGHLKAQGTKERRLPEVAETNHD